MCAYILTEVGIPRDYPIRGRFIGVANPAEGLWSGCTRFIVVVPGSPAHSAYIALRCINIHATNTHMPDLPRLVPAYPIFVAHAFEFEAGFQPNPDPRPVARFCALNVSTTTPGNVAQQASHRGSTLNDCRMR